LGLALAMAIGADAAQIVGGKSISITEAPWQLHMGGCGASWLGGKWVLTAAHCLDDSPDPAETWVHAGITRTREESNTTRTRAARIILHPDYRKSTCANCDIALVELVSPITRPLAKPIPLATPADAAAGLEKKGLACFATGWGFLDPKYTRTPDSLQGVHSVIYGTDKTTIRWAGNGTDTVGSCMGDSGGPLAIKDAMGRWILAGVSSTIPGGGSSLICGDPDGPPNYTRVSNFQPWIVGITGALSTAVARDGADARIVFLRDNSILPAGARFPETAVFDLSGARKMGRLAPGRYWRAAP
jgi:secreted trypsin-like serine protease